MKGFTKKVNGKNQFIPTSRTKSALKKSDVMKKTVHGSDYIRLSQSKKSIEPKMKSFEISSTTMYPDGYSDFETQHVDTIQAKDFEDAEKQVIKMFELKSEDVMEVGVDLGENTVGYEFEHIPHDARTGEEITQKQADKLIEGKDGDDAVSWVVHGFEIEEDMSEDDPYYVSKGQQKEWDDDIESSDAQQEVFRAFKNHEKIQEEDFSGSYGVEGDRLQAVLGDLERAGLIKETFDLDDPLKEFSNWEKTEKFSKILRKYN